jgi:hypothetical protein
MASRKNQVKLPKYQPTIENVKRIRHAEAEAAYSCGAAFRGLDGRLPLKITVLPWTAG